MPPLHLDESGQIGVVAIHAVDPLDGDDDAAIVATEVSQEPIELVGVVVAKRPHAGLRGRRALHDAVVGQFVVEDEVAGAKEVGEERGVRAVAAGKHRGPLGADEGGQLHVELVE